MVSLPQVWQQQMGQYFSELVLGLFGFSIDLPGNPFPWRLDQIILKGIYKVLSILITAFLDAIGFFFRLGLEVFLFYQNPREIQALNSYWNHTIPVYIFIVFVTMSGYWVVMMLLPDNEDASIQRIVKRFILSGIFVAVSRDVFAFFVSLTNMIAWYVYPKDYTFHMALGLLESLVNGAGVGFAALFIAVAGGLGVLVTGMIFYIVLAMRMLIIYIVYALMPVLIGLWVVDVGPGKYGKFLSDLLFKTAAVMMIFGILIAGILAVGAAFGDANSSVKFASDYDGEDGTVVLSTDQYGPRSSIESKGGGGQLGSGFGNVVYNICIFLGTIWLLLSTVTSLGGVILSASATNPGGAGGYRGSRSRSSGGASSGSEQGVYGARYEEHSTGSMYMQETESGNVVMANPAGEGVVINPDNIGPTGDGPVIPDEQNWPVDWSDDTPVYETFSSDENPLAREDAGPNPFNTEVEPVTDEVPLRRKADHLSGGRISDGKETAGRYREEIEDWLREQGYAGETLLLAGNMARRGGSAYWSVFKQPTVGESIGEATRIARESPIGKPSSPDDGEFEEDVEFASGAGAFEMGRQGVDRSSGWATAEASSEAASAKKGATSAADVDHAVQEEEWMSSGTKGVVEDLGVPESFDGFNEEFYDEVYDVVVSRPDIPVSSRSELEKEIGPEELRSMVNHQERVGMSTETVAKSVAETLSNPHADVIGPEMQDVREAVEVGVGVPDESVKTHNAVRKVDVSSEVVGDSVESQGRVWRYETEDGRVVYLEDRSSDAHRTGEIASDEVLDELGVDVGPDHYYDSTEGVLRRSGVKGSTLEEVSDSRAVSAGDSDGQITGSGIEDESIGEGRTSSGAVSGGEAERAPAFEGGDGRSDGESVEDIHGESGEELGASSKSPKVDKESFLDTYASSALVGDESVDPSTVRIQEDGTVKRSSFTRPGNTVDQVGDTVVQQAEEHADQLGIDVDQGDVKDRMEELSNEFEANTFEMKNSVSDRVATDNSTIRGRDIAVDQLEALEDLNYMIENIDQMRRR